MKTGNLRAETGELKELVRGVRVDGDTVIVSVKGGNEAARQLCAELVAMIDQRKEGAK
jgi:hypothetical protein